MLTINNELQPSGLSKLLSRFWELSGNKIKNIAQHYDISKGSPVFTVKGNIPPAAGLNGRRASSLVRPYYNMMPPAKKNFSNQDATAPSHLWHHM